MMICPKWLTLYLLLLVFLIGGSLSGQAQEFKSKVHSQTAVLPNSSDQFSSWKEVSPEGEGFSIKFPGEPRIKEMIGTIEVSKGKLLRLLQFDGGSLFYQITYCSISPEEARQAQSKLKGEVTTEDAAKIKDKLGSEMLDKRSLTVEGYPAKDIINAGPTKGYGRSLTLATNTHIYVLALGAMTLEAVRSKEAEYFLNSFKLTDRRSADSTHSPTFTSLEGGFTISLPEKPSVQSSQSTGPAGGGLEVHVFGWETPLGEFSIMYMDTAKNLEDLSLSKALLAKARDDALKKENGKLLGEKDISLAGHVGREFKIGASNGIFIDRVGLTQEPS